MFSNHNTRILAAVVCGVALSAFTGSVQAASVSAWEIDSVEGFSNGSWSFGDIFTVGSSNITVTSLGALDVNKDGFATTGGIAVGLFRESDSVLLASSSVLSTDSLSGNYRFSDIADIQLDANTAYRVVAVSGSDLYNITTGTPNSVDPGITWNSYGYCNTTALTSCNSFTGIERTWMANFQLDNGSNNVPEPQSLFLVAVAGLALAAVRRRKV